MSKTVKIAISLPDDLLQGIERERRVRGESRSEFVRRAVEAMLRREQDLEEQYIRGYREHPETSEEMAGLVAASLVVLAHEPWDEKDGE